MASFNQVTLLGNATRDVELRYLASGMAVAEMGMAISEKRKDKNSGEMVEDVVFVDITFWGRTAEVAAEYVSKGSPVLVSGRLKLDSWQTQDGQKRSKLKVVGDRMQLLGSRSDSFRQDSPPNEGVDEPSADGF